MCVSNNPHVYVTQLKHLTEVTSLSQGEEEQRPTLYYLDKEQNNCHIQYVPQNFENNNKKEKQLDSNM